MTNQTESNETQDEKTKLSHRDKDLESDYRPTRYGSTDEDRKEKNSEDRNSSKSTKQ